MRVFVAGASGAIGEPLIAELLKRGHSVMGMTTSETRARILEGQGASAAIVDALNRETNAGLADAKIMARLADMGGMVLAGSPADFGKLIADETAKWAKVIKAAGIKPQ